MTEPGTQAISATSRPVAADKLVVQGLVALAATVGVIQVILADFPPLLWLSSSCLGLIAITCLLRLLAVPGFVTPWAVYATSLGLGYGIGTVNTLARGYLDGISILQVTYADKEHIALAVGFVLVLVAMLLLAGSLDKARLIPSSDFTKGDRQAMLGLLMFFAAAAVMGVLTGSIGFGGGQGSEEGSGRISAFGNLLSSSMTAAMATGLFVFANDPNPKTKRIALLLCLVLMAPILLGGRRSFIFGLLVGGIAFFAAAGPKILFNKRAIAAILTIGIATVFIAKFYFAMRIASHRLDPNPGVTQLVSGAWDVITHPEDGLDEANAENQATRPFIVGYFAELLQLSAPEKTTGGDLLFLDLATVVPTAIWPGKWRVIQMIGSEEIACHPVLGIPSWDAANNILTAGLCDFWIPGVFMYPLGLMLLYSLIHRLLTRLPGIVHAMVGFATAEVLFQVETTITTYFVSLRNLIMIGAFVWAVLAVIRYVNGLPLVQYELKQRALRKQRLAELRAGRP